MFQHVVERAGRCKDLKEIALATDDERIFNTAKSLNVKVVMTRKDHASGTDRVFEAAELLSVPDNAVVVNIQGDEPALNPSMLYELLHDFHQPEVQVTTLARRIAPEEAENPDRVKVVFAKDGKALYFSRSFIPFFQNPEGTWIYGHIGLYAFRMSALRKFVAMGPGRLEETEKLEQLRLLENGVPIHVTVTEHRSIGVDRPEDIAFVTDILAGDSAPPL